VTRPPACIESGRLARRVHRRRPRPSVVLNESAVAKLNGGSAPRRAKAATGAVPAGTATKSIFKTRQQQHAMANEVTRRSCEADKGRRTGARPFRIWIRYGCGTQCMHARGWPARLRGALVHTHTEHNHTCGELEFIRIPRAERISRSDGRTRSAHGRSELGLAPSQGFS
jgi:hypothetical protein